MKVNSCREQCQSCHTKLGKEFPTKRSPLSARLVPTSATPSGLQNFFTVLTSSIVEVHCSPPDTCPMELRKSDILCFHPEPIFSNSATQDKHFLFSLFDSIQPKMSRSAYCQDAVGRATCKREPSDFACHSPRYANTGRQNDNLKRNKKFFR
ncbi:hypothetical protein BDV41DRAFT_310549 [Aspergillus transmontanensis]|uniref:Uncharacterized protein n=1 Tax=Aspergillus transmontanensis TaxID=1034304 RepID=A0A5N6VUW3_9EURO|nr:hypothetical protein BDV41DRAFT_310549 [Aspergillus transmontanensis]